MQHKIARTIFIKTYLYKSLQYLYLPALTLFLETDEYTAVKLQVYLPYSEVIFRYCGNCWRIICWDGL